MSRSKGLVLTKRSFQKKIFKTLALTVEKVISKVKVFSKKGQGHKVKNVGTTERSCHKEYSCEISKKSK